MTDSPSTRSGADPALARHHVANLLHGYTEVADRKDVRAGVELLGSATVRFPDDGYDRPQDAVGFFERLWGNDVAHRHDVTNLVVEATGAGRWHARAHYTRYVLSPDPLLATLGEYDVDVREDGGRWTIAALTVTRTWSR